MSIKNKNKELSELIDKARSNIEKNNLGGDQPSINYQFGSTDGFGFGNKYWNHTPRKIKAIRFITEGL